MEKVIINENNLTDNDINEIETRVKAILINDDNEVLIGYSYNCYQFVGGHVEQGEDLLISLEREIKEEAGIDIYLENIKPEACYIKYNKEENKKIIIYYYIIRTNEEPHLECTNYTKEEKIGNFELRYIKLSDLKEEIINNKNKYPVAIPISEEMLAILDKLNNLKDYIDK